MHRLSVVRLKFGSDEKATWISAINHDRLDQISLMTDQYEPNQFLSVTTENGKSALMSACKEGSLELVTSLVGAGADVNEKTLTQGTPFMFAVLGGHLSIAMWLKEQDADINVAGSNGWTALTIAAAKGYVDILRWLIDEGLDPQARDVYRFTPLMRAVDNGFVEAAALLLTLSQTDVNARDEYENTALHHAVSANNIPMVSLLLEHGADHLLKNRDGLSPYAMNEHLRYLFAE